MQKAQSPQMASFLERAVALFIDSIIVGIGSYIIIIPLAILAGIAGISMPSEYGDAFGVLFIIGLYFLMLLAPISYFIYFYTTSGQTLGKKVMNIKVVRIADHSYMSWGRVLLREIVGRFVSSLLFGLGYFWYFSSNKRQAWHDSISDTVVVKTDPMGKILLDGPAEYPQEYAKTFVPCGCITLFYAAIIFGVMMMGVAISQSEATAKKALQKKTESKTYINQKYTESQDLDTFIVDPESTK